MASTFAAPAERNDLRKIEKTLSLHMKHYRVRSAGEALAA
jgi:hypothetical protein